MITLFYQSTYFFLPKIESQEQSDALLIGGYIITQWFLSYLSGNLEHIYHVIE